MAWSVIRRATQDDVSAYRTAVEEFMARHRDEFAVSSVSHPSELLPRYLTYRRGTVERHLAAAWRREVERAFGRGAEGIAWGTVGYYVP